MPTQVCHAHHTHDLSKMKYTAQDQSRKTSFLHLSLTDSELQIALVALFSEMLYRFPNVVVAQVTRDSVQQAIANGITAQQVRDARSRCYPQPVSLQIGLFF